MKKLLILLAALAFCASAQAAIVHSGQIQRINGPEELDLTGNIVYAIDVYGDGTRTVAGVPFVSDRSAVTGYAIAAQNAINNWGTRPEFGGTADDDEFEEIVWDIRWSWSSSNVRADMDVIPGHDYKLTLVANENGGGTRHQDIYVEGVMVVDDYNTRNNEAYSSGRATIWTGELTAYDNQLNVLLGPAGVSGDNNPILQAIIVEDLGAGVAKPANGSFEEPVLADGTFQYTPAGSSWTLNGGSGIANYPGTFTNGNPPPPDGDQVAFLQGATSIEQARTDFTPDAKYELSWSHANRGDYGGDNDLVIELVDSVAGTYTLYDSGGAITDTDWAANTSPEFVPSSTDATLRVRTTNPLGGDNSTLVDNFVLTQITGATGHTFTAQADGNWSNPNLWDPIGVPGAQDSAVLDGDQVTLDGAVSGLDTVTVSGAGALDLNSNTLSAATLYVQNGGSVARTGGGSVAANLELYGNSTSFTMTDDDAIGVVFHPQYDNTAPTVNLRNQIGGIAWVRFHEGNPQYNLVDDLLVTGDITPVKGTLKLNDNNLTVNGSVTLGGNNHHAYRAAYMTRDLAGENLAVEGTFTVFLSGTAAFASGDSVGGLSTVGFGSGVGTVTQYDGRADGLTITGSTLSVASNPGALTLNFDSVLQDAPDWALKIAGNQTATLDALKDNGAMVLNIPNAYAQRIAGVWYDAGTNATYVGMNAGVRVWDNPGSDAWATGTNWDPDLTPGATSATFVDNGGTANVTGAAQAQVLFVDNGGVDVQSGGSLTVADKLDVAAAGVLNVSGALTTPDVNTLGATTIDGTVTGTVHVDGGSATVSGGSVTTLNANAGASTVSGGTVGALNANGGAVDVSGSVGTLTVKAGTVNLNAGAAITTLSLAPSSGGIDLRSLAGTNVSASSYYSPDDRSPRHVSDWSGQTGTFPSGTAGSGPGGTMWLTNNATGTGSYIAWDLGSVHTIDSMHVWNYNEGGNWIGRGVKTFDLQTSSDGANWTTVDTIDWSDTAQYRGTGSADYAGFDYTLPTPITTQYLRFNDTQNYGTSDNYTGLSEVVFQSASSATVNVTGNASAATVDVSGGDLNLAGGDLSVDTIAVSGGTVNAGANNVLVGSRMELEQASYALSGASNFGAGGAITKDGAERLELNGGNLTITGPSAVPVGAVGYWSFDNSGDVGHDDTGNGHNGALLGDAGYSGSGKIGGALALDGNGDYVSVPDATDLRLTGDFAISFWSNKAFEQGDWQRIIGKGDSTYRNYGVWDESGGGTRLLLQQYGSGGYSMYSTVGIGANTWAHVVAMVEGNTASIYIDGQLQGSVTQSCSPYTSADPLTFGYAGIHTYFPGLLDEIFIYDRALTSDEITALYNAGVAGAYPSGGLDLGGTDIVMNAVSTLTLDTDGAATLGDLIFADLNAGLTVAAGPSAIGFDLLTLDLDTVIAEGVYTLLTWDADTVFNNFLSGMDFSLIDDAGFTWSVNDYLTEGELVLTVASGAAIPEPATLALVSLAMLGLVTRRR